MSETPRTDALARLERIIESPHDYRFEEIVGADLARQLESENAELREALAPFVALLQEHHDDLPDSQPLFGINDATIHIGQLRRARALLARVEGK